MEITVLPDPDSFLRSYINERDVSESSPLVGSSKNIKDGLVINSTPIDVLFRSPPEIPLIITFPISVSAHLVKPNSYNNPVTLFSLS